MDKTLIQVPLTELRTNDEEVLGSVFNRDGKEYVWVKNAGSTSLVAAGCCLMVITSVADNVRKVSLIQSFAATGQAIGCMAIGTSSQPATAPFDRGYAPTADSASTANLYARKVVFVASLTSTGPATAASALVDIQCR